jgi:uncharacterized protein (DUF488 family)
MTTIYTIGFAEKPAARFFDLLRQSGVQRLVDIRLHPKGQLSGFAKQGDLAYFLSALLGCEYQHMTALAPDEEMFAAYRQDRDWAAYAHRFQALLEERDIAQTLDRGFFEEKACCLLCSEATPEKCHRRLVAEYLAREWTGTKVVHLV